MQSSSKISMGDVSKLRIAIVNKDKCKPSKCGLECKRCCPSNMNENLCIEVNKKDKISVIHEGI
jgi:ATP-binding cassette subfamily E protein 1